mmetsp:Transcript_5496/g.12984  ORF Transcript_5496/g.12984 Transcript_5496/m.12984 type:complete len:332 (+) Transcript_5496:834-1829(+)
MSGQSGEGVVVTLLLLKSLVISHRRRIMARISTDDPGISSPASMANLAATAASHSFAPCRSISHPTVRSKEASHDSLAASSKGKMVVLMGRVDRDGTDGEGAVGLVLLLTTCIWPSRTSRSSCGRVMTMVSSVPSLSAQKFAISLGRSPGPPLFLSPRSTLSMVSCSVSHRASVLASTGKALQDGRRLSRSLSLSGEGDPPWLPVSAVDRVVDVPVPLPMAALLVLLETGGGGGGGGLRTIRVAVLLSSCLAARRAVDRGGCGGGGGCCCGFLGKAGRGGGGGGQTVVSFLHALLVLRVWTVILRDCCWCWWWCWWSSSISLFLLTGNTLC